MGCSYGASRWLPHERRDVTFVVRFLDFGNGTHGMKGLCWTQRRLKLGIISVGFLAGKLRSRPVRYHLGWRHASLASGQMGSVGEVYRETAKQPARQQTKDKELENLACPDEDGTGAGGGRYNVEREATEDKRVGSQIDRNCMYLYRASDYGRAAYTDKQEAHVYTAGGAKSASGKSSFGV